MSKKICSHMIRKHVSKKLRVVAANFAHALEVCLCLALPQKVKPRRDFRLIGKIKDDPFRYWRADLENCLTK